ncbi:hypothetical protein ACMS0O_004204 [Cronobacter malonaticus]
MAQFCVAARPGGLPGARIHRWLARARHKSPLAPAGPNIVPVRGVYGTDYGDEYQRVLRSAACFEAVTICCHTEKDRVPGLSACGGDNHNGRGYASGVL